MLDDVTRQRFAELGIAQRAALENAPHDGTIGKAYFAANGSLVATREQGSPWPEPTDSTLIVREYPGPVIRLIGEQRRDYRLVDGVLVKVADGTPVNIPTLPVPAKITRWQGRKWLHAAGLLVTIEAAIQAGGLDAQIEYEAGEWYRDSEFLRGMASALLPEGTDVDGWLDGMFCEAATL